MTYAVVEKNTFSSALMFAVIVRDNKLTTVIVEVPERGHPNHFGEVIYFKTPSTQLAFWFGVKQWIIPSGELENNVLTPDIPIALEGKLRTAKIDEISIKVKIDGWTKINSNRIITYYPLRVSSNLTQKYRIMKMNFCIILIFVCCYCLGQNKLYPFPFSYPKELKFYSADNSKNEITEEELKNFRIIDTISNPYSFLINDISSISIAIRTSNNYNVYRLLTKSENNTLTLKEIGDPRNRCASSLQVTDIKSIRLDKSGNDELILKFIHNSYCCQTCAVPMNWHVYEGYVIFDFDKLKVLEITTRSNVLILSNGVPAKDVVIKFEKNYLRFGRRKYYYKNDVLVRR